MWCTTGLRSWFPFPAPAASHELVLAGPEQSSPGMAHIIGTHPPNGHTGVLLFTRYSVIPLYCLFVGMGIAIGYAEYQCVGARCVRKWGIVGGRRGVAPPSTITKEYPLSSFISKRYLEF